MYQDPIVPFGMRVERYKNTDQVKSRFDRIAAMTFLLAYIQVSLFPPIISETMHVLSLSHYKYPEPREAKSPVPFQIARPDVFKIVQPFNYVMKPITPMLS